MAVWLISKLASPLVYRKFSLFKEKEEKFLYSSPAKLEPNTLDMQAWMEGFTNSPPLLEPLTSTLDLEVIARKPSFFPYSYFLSTL